MQIRTLTVACLQRSAPHTAHFYTFVVPGACQIRSPSHAHTTFTGGVLRDDDLLAPLLSKVEGQSAFRSILLHYARNVAFFWIF